MNNIAVIYKSNYGTTKQYADWIAEALGADLFESSSIKPEKLMTYDIVVYGGGLYASGILGVDLVIKNPCNRLVIFTVGLADPDTTDYTEILTKNLPADLRNTVKVFHLHGGIDYKKLGFIHKKMMAMLKKQLDKKPAQERTEENKYFLETYGDKIDFTSKKTIVPITTYVQTLRRM